VLRGEGPVAAKLRQRLPAHVLEDSLLLDSSLVKEPHDTQASTGAGDMSIDDLRSQGLAARGVPGGSFEEADNGGLEALEGSLIEGSGKALVRNGRLHLLEWKPSIDRKIEYCTILPQRPQSASSNLSDSPYRTSSASSKRPSSRNSLRSSGGTGAVKKQGARQVPPGGSIRVGAGWTDHVKMRQAADEWLAGQTNIRKKLQELLPIPHGTKSSRAKVPRLHIHSPLPSGGGESTFRSSLPQTAGFGVDGLPEKEVRARSLRLRNMWKGDLQASCELVVSRLCMRAYAFFL
jgi:hypothetical protein